VTTILGVIGSMREAAHTDVLVRIALDAAGECGAETKLLDLRTEPLPMYEAHRDYDEDQRVARILKLVDWAEGFIVGSPEYHGCMSGAAKNFFDFLYREIAGKVFGLVAATGGSQGVSCCETMRTAILYCHGWVLPYNVAANGRDFDADGNLANAKVRDRLMRLGRDVRTYAPIMHAQFQTDLKQPADAKPGFAQWLA